MDTKHCSRCKKFKPKSEFCKNRTRHDGLQTTCNECQKARRNRQTDAYKEGRSRRTMRHRANNPVQRKARYAVDNAVRDGRLVRQPCEVCGDPVSEAHHDDYTKPLMVRWLCNQDHNEWHQNNQPKYS